MKIGGLMQNGKLYKYKVLLPSRHNKKKLVPTIFYFTNKDLERLFDFYGIPYDRIILR